MSTAAPTIPPRPARVQQAAAARGVNKLPEIPPRPIPKRLDRSVSPGNYPRSPLNEPFAALSKTKSNDAGNQPALPKRPSVQNLPSVGQEGMEYADIDTTPEPSPVAPTEQTQTRSVAHDLHLHAPKPSLPKSAAAAQVQTVTRTDSGTAAAHGFGKPGTPGHDDHQESDPLGRVRSRASFSRPNSSASGGRRASVNLTEEQGPAELGMRVPINPLLGDVQAPSPAPFTPSHTGEKRRPHSRVKSRDGLPPGSYGLHGHGVAPTDPFERDWYAKHPDELQHEEAHGHGVYEGIGSGRGAFALSSDDLNKIVRDTASRGAGFATTGNTMSYPDEQIGYMASDQYTGGNPLTKSLTNVSQPAVESPLRKSSLPAVDMDPIVSVSSKRTVSGSSDPALESPLQTPVHIASPEHRFNKITGGEETMNETEEHGISLSRPTTGQGHDSDYSVPILAADEVAKEPVGEHMQAAISPRMDRRSSEYDYRSGDVTPTSRPASRPNSIHGMHSGSHGLSRFVSHHDERDNLHTPLEDVDEYEPLFPDDEHKRKELSHAERFKQKDALKHRFPSKDIWEDAPDYGMYQATVSTPDLPQEAQPKPSAAFESPEQEAAGKGEHSEADRKRRVQQAALPSHLQSEVTARPGLQPRFPSQDIWEDSPDSQHLVTTVSSPPVEDDSLPVEAPAKPMIPPRPVNKSKLADGASAAQPAPSVPARPAKKMSADSPPLTREVSPTELKKTPSIPDRPKPQVPPRPAKKVSGETLTKTISPESDQSNVTERAIPVTSPPLPKVKPQVPARPAQPNKFANLKGNFMNDLNQKLGLGPPKEKEPEPEPVAEAKPLEDARKGRARGPQRRAPAKSPSAAPATQTTEKPKFSMSKPQSLWHIADDGLLNVGSVEALRQVEGAKGFATADESVPVDTEKLQQIENATVSDAPLPPSVDTTRETKASEEADSRPEDAPPALAPSLATNAQGDYPDPTLGTPTQEKSNPLSHQATNEEAVLSQHTTASSTVASGPELEREVPDPNTDAIPVSKHTTASTHIGEELERSETKAPEEPIELRNEQVNAPAPGPAVAEAAPKVSAASATKSDTMPTVTKEQVQDAAVGADHAAEPMPEQDVSYAQLEAMQTQADGKEPSDGGVKKIMD